MYYNLLQNRQKSFTVIINIGRNLTKLLQKFHGYRFFFRTQRTYGVAPSAAKRHAPPFSATVADRRVRLAAGRSGPFYHEAVSAGGVLTANR